jgi:hypothetical protein
MTGSRPKIPRAVHDVANAALHGNLAAFDRLHGQPELERQARALYADRVHAGDEPPNVSSSNSPRPAR